MHVRVIVRVWSLSALSLSREHDVIRVRVRVSGRARVPACIWACAQARDELNHIESDLFKIASFFLDFIHEVG